MIKEFYNEHYDDAVRIMRRIFKGDTDTAEDIVQEAFLKLVQKQDLFDPNKGNIKPWFNSIMFNVMRDHKRGIKDKDVVPNDNISFYDTLNEVSIKEREGLDDLIQCEIDKLSNEKHKLILHLFFIKGYAIKDISYNTKTSVSNVKVILHRFRSLLDD